MGFTEVEVDDDKRLETEFTYTQWANYIILRQSLVQDIDTDDDRDASWQWEVESEWIRLS